MQSSTSTETTSKTATPTNDGADGQSVSPGANNYIWILPFTIACAIIYWYLTKRRYTPEEIANQKTGSTTSTGNRGPTRLEGSSADSANDDSNREVRQRQSKLSSKKKQKNKKKPSAKPQAQEVSSPPQPTGLSKRERKMLAARLTPVALDSSESERTFNSKDSSTSSADGDATLQPAVKAIFEPIRVAAAPSKPDAEREVDQPNKVERKRETPIEVVTKPPTKTGVFVPQKRELLVADRNADRWGPVETAIPAFATQQSQVVRENSSPIEDEQSSPSASERETESQSSSRSGLKSFVSKVRAKTTQDSESSASAD